MTSFVFALGFYATIVAFLGALHIVLAWKDEAFLRFMSRRYAIAIAKKSNGGDRVNDG